MKEFSKFLTKIAILAGILVMITGSIVPGHSVRASYSGPTDGQIAVPFSSFDWGGSRVSTGHEAEPAPAAPLADLDVEWIGRTPRFAYDAAQKWPNPGQPVVFEGHIANRGNLSSGPFTYVWKIDGVTLYSSTHPGLAPSQTDVLSFSWGWQVGVHTVSLYLDSSAAMIEVTENNNQVSDRTNALALGIVVERAVYDTLNQLIVRASWGGNSFADWIQHHVSIWNDMFASAVHPLTPDGIIDRVRLDKITVVENGAIQCNTNLPGNKEDKELDLVWGYASEMVGVPGAGCDFTPRYRDSADSWEKDMGLIHELNHARYLIDLYGLGVSAHHQTLEFSIGVQDQWLTLDHVPDFIEYTPPFWLIVEGEIMRCVERNGNTIRCERGQAGTYARAHPAGASSYADQILLTDGKGNALAGSTALPRVDTYGFYVSRDFAVDIMFAGEKYGEHSAMAWNLIAGQRPVCGNYNAPCNIGAYINNIPSSNKLQILSEYGCPVAGASVEVYRARPYPLWYGKSYLGTPDLTLVTNANGVVDLGSQPLGGPVVHTYGHSNAVLLLKVTAGNRVMVDFVDITDMNMEVWGGKNPAYYPVTIDHWMTPGVFEPGDQMGSPDDIIQFSGLAGSSLGEDIFLPNLQGGRCW